MKEKIIGIYMIRCKVNEKCYIGQSTNIKRRWYTHINELNRNVHICKKLQEDWNAYGESNFEFKIIQECTKDDVCSASLWCFSSISSNGCGGKR